MKNLKFILPVYLVFHFTAYSQIINGSFETADTIMGSALGWSYNCGVPELVEDTPPNSGNRSIKICSPDMIGWCYPGIKYAYVYQPLPFIKTGETWSFSVWMKKKYDGTNMKVYADFGKIDDTPYLVWLAGVGTLSDTWVNANVTHTFSLNATDTAVIYFDVDFAMDGTGLYYGYFDNIEISQVTSVKKFEEEKSLRVFPNPAADEITVKIDPSIKLQDAVIKITDVLGREVKEISEIKGNEVKISLAGLKQGIYLLKLGTYSQRLIINK